MFTRLVKNEDLTGYTPQDDASEFPLADLRLLGNTTPCLILREKLVPAAVSLSLRLQAEMTVVAPRGLATWWCFEYVSHLWSPHCPTLSHIFAPSAHKEKRPHYFELDVDCDCTTQEC